MIGQGSHWPMGLDKDGYGPETDPDLIERVVCAFCDPVEEWPCAAYVQAGKDDITDPLF